jgi:hypothetical protein
MLRELGPRSERAALFAMPSILDILGALVVWLIGLALLLGCAWAIFDTTRPREVPDENRQRGFEVLPPK